ncbi:MAG: HIT family protein [Pacificimonas sp.]
MNATIEKFGYPDTLIRAYDHWVVLLRPAQPTLGALVLAAKSEATAFAALPADAFAEQAKVIYDIETALSEVVNYEKINYLMLMMVDPYVHYHVIPRYEGARSHGELTIRDAGWPKLPDLGASTTPMVGQRERLISALQAVWPT